MNTDACHRFNFRKRPSPADGRLSDHFHGPPRKRRVPRVYRVPRFYREPIPDCLLTPPPEASADFNMTNFLFSLPHWLRSRLGNGLELIRCWARVPKDAPRHTPDLTFLTRDDDLEAGRVVGSWRVEDPIKVALEAAAPPPPPEKKKPFWEKAFEGAKQYDQKLSQNAAQIILLEKELEEQRKLAEALEEQRKLAEAPEEDLSGFFTPLTVEEEREVHDCLYTGSGSKVLVLHESSNIEVSREKIRCLRPGGWLNDEVINLYLELLKERRVREPKRFLKCHFFNTFFYKKLACGKTGYDYKSVKRWTTVRKLGYELIECDKIFVPVHQNVHWCLAIINMKAKTLQYLDSLGGNDPRVPRMLARYIVEEVKDKSNKEIDIGSWTEEVVEYIPLQQNGYDCGVFMLKYIDFLSRGDSLSFGQEHMGYFRKRTAKEILRLRAD